jgi:hypothetical protein
MPLAIGVPTVAPCEPVPPVPVCACCAMPCQTQSRPSLPPPIAPLRVELARHALVATPSGLAHGGTAAEQGGAKRGERTGEGDGGRLARVRVEAVRLAVHALAGALGGRDRGRVCGRAWGAWSGVEFRCAGGLAGALLWACARRRAGGRVVSSSVVVVVAGGLQAPRGLWMARSSRCSLRRVSARLCASLVRLRASSLPAGASVWRLGGE